MSCHWRLTSHDQWEMSQSNPPSELPNDPIISTSSNPDERSSSPDTQSEPARNSRSPPAHETGDSLFSHAAQAETEPIPRGEDTLNPEDLLIPDSPVYSSLPSDIDDHIVALRPKQAKAMEPPKPNSQSVRRKKDAGATKSDLDDSDFEILESDENESDSDYVAEMTTRRRGKKKAPSKMDCDKAANKQQIDKNNDTQSIAVITRESKTTTEKGRSQKPKAVSKTVPKHTKQATNSTSVRNSMANALANSTATSMRTSGRPRGGNKEKRGEQSGNGIPNSQALPVETRAGRKQLSTRLPKKTFYSESKDDASIRDAQNENNTAKHQLDSDKKTSNKQNSNSRNNGPPTSPIVLDDNDVVYLSDSPKEQERDRPPKAQIGSQASPIVPDAVVGPNSKKKRSPNSKKKRSPPQSGPKSRNAKKINTRTYGQKVTNNLGSSELFRESNNEAAQREKRARPVESKQPKEPGVAPSDQGMSLILKEVDHSHQAEKQTNEMTKQKAARSETIEEPARGATTPGLDSQPSVDMTSVSPSKPTPSELPKPDVQAVPMILPTLAPVSNTTNDEATSMVIRPLPAHTQPRELGASSTRNGSFGKAQAEKFSDSHQAITSQRALSLKEGPGIGSSTQQPRVSDSTRDLGEIDIYLDQPQEIHAPIEKQQPFLKDANNQQLLDMTPIPINTRSRVDESGSPSRPSNIAAGTIQTFERRPLQELQQPINQKERVDLPTRPQAPFKPSSVWPLQMTSDSEPQLARTDISLPTDHVPRPQAGMGRPKTLENLENHQPLSNPVSRIVLSPSSSSGHPAERSNDLVAQAPRLNPKSIDFASRIAWQQKDMKYNQDNQALNGREDYKSSKRPSWPQFNISSKPQNDPKLLPPKAGKLGHILGEQSLRGHESRSSNPTSKPGYETKWQEAVDAASGGVVDTLHFISTNLLEHLRTREQSVFAVVNEYKRNGTKVCEKLAKRQASEWFSTSTTVEKKYLELATLYEGVSRKTQDFRAKCLSKHRNQAYTEWQRQTTRIKGAIRKAKEEALLG
ncbi:hypothetical protein F4776DRAFT_549357 [Hypoxylon sp. NC0597]|nr:hypothetical protein F4776DRAFT_549357 [Hypoxylon sp. NC0597]